MTVEDEEILLALEASELETPSPRKVIGDRLIYQSRELQRPRQWGSLVLTDFGEARVGQQRYRHTIQPELYRAPEILLHLDWNHKVGHVLGDCP